MTAKPHVAVGPCARPAQQPQQPRLLRTRKKREEPSSAQPDNWLWIHRTTNIGMNHVRCQKSSEARGEDAPINSSNELQKNFL